MSTRNQFEKWAVLHVGNRPAKFAGQIYGSLWMYADAEMETHWMCWKAALASRNLY